MGVSICLKSFFEKKEKSIKMQLFVRGYLGVHTVDVTGFESVESLRNHVCQLEGIDEVENQILNFNGAPLIEEEPLLACGLSELTTIEMTSRLLGGKVHGSLARAGKVKGQTSKVEKQKKTGRARRRIQYNRRFVNVVATFGRKKGPNSNSWMEGRSSSMLPTINRR